MKKLFRTFLAVAAFAALTGVSSCTKVCDTGYEGDKCDVQIREKFTGVVSTTYRAIEDGSNSSPADYTIVISKSNSDIQKILITNMWDLFTNNVVATVDGNEFTIASQEPDNDGFVVQGSGTISGDVITVNYSVTDNNSTPATTDVITNGTWTKQ